MEGHEAYTPYDGPYWAHHHHPKALRKRAANRYPGYRLHILNAAGEGECRHPDCTAARILHIQQQLDLHHNTDRPPPPDLSCRRRPPQLVGHSPTAATPKQPALTSGVQAVMPTPSSPPTTTMHRQSPNPTLSRAQTQASLDTFFGSAAPPRAPRSQPTAAPAPARRRRKQETAGTHQITVWMPQPPQPLPPSGPPPTRQQEEPPSKASGIG